MKKFMIFLSTVISITSVAQQQTFDITTFTPPKGWKKQAAESAIQFSTEDAAKGTYCLITLYKSVPGTSNSKENFDLAWESIVKEMVTVSASPEIQPPATENGWEVQSGIAAFESEGTKGGVVLVTSSGFEKMVNVIVLTNSDVYEKDISAFFESVSIKKLTGSNGKVNKPTTIPVIAPVENNKPNEISVIGSWGKSNSVSQLNNRFGTYSYNKQQYTFNPNSTYTFLGKNYSEDYAETILIKESGTYTTKGNVLTINPKTSIIEAWSKKNGADNYNQLKSTQKRALENATYQVKMEGKNLNLSIAKETTRDGRFSNSNYYSYGPPETFTAIKLPGQ